VYTKNKFHDPINMPPVRKKPSSRMRPLLSVMGLTEKLERKNIHCQKPGNRDECRGYRYCEAASARRRLSLKTSGCQNYSEAAKKLRTLLAASQKEEAGARPASRLTSVASAREDLRQAIRHGSDAERARAKKALADRLKDLPSNELIDISRRRRQTSSPRAAANTESTSSRNVEESRRADTFQKVLQAVTNANFLTPNCEAIIAYKTRSRSPIQTTAPFRGGFLSPDEVRNYYVPCPGTTVLEAAASISTAVHQLLKREARVDASSTWDAQWEHEHELGGEPLLEEINIKHDSEQDTVIVEFVLNLIHIDVTPPGEEISDSDYDDQGRTTLIYKQTRGGSFQFVRTDGMDINEYVENQTIRALEEDFKERDTYDAYPGEITVRFGAPGLGGRDSRPYLRFHEASFGFMRPRRSTMAVNRAARDIDKRYLEGLREARSPN